MMQTIIAVVIMLAVLQTTDAMPSCSGCRLHGRLCLYSCTTDNCADKCEMRKVACYSSCNRSKRETVFNALADKDLSESFA